MSDVLSSFMVYCIQFKEFKILWKSGARVWGPEDPNIHFLLHNNSAFFAQIKTSIPKNQDLVNFVFR